MRMLKSIKYEIRGVTKTNSRLRSYAFRETLAFDIPEVDGSDAPVAIDWIPQTAPHSCVDGIRDRAISGPDGRQLTRWHDGAHWQRLCDGHFYGKRECGPAISVAHLEAMLDNPNQDLAAISAIGIPESGFSRPTARFTPVDGDPRDRFIAITEDGRASAIKVYEEAVANLIVVDGQLHRRSIEPYISVELGIDEGKAAIRTVGIETTADALWNPGTKLFVAFGLSEMDSAEEFISNPAYHDRHSDPRIPPLNVFVDDSLTYDWRVSYQAAMKARQAQKALSMFSRTRGLKLEGIIAAQDADEQHDILMSIDVSEPEWAENRSALTLYQEMVEILDDRSIKMPLSAMVGSNPCGR